MKIITITFLFCTAIFVQLKAQTETPARFSKAIFFEAFGHGLHGSLNYDMRLRKGTQNGFGFRMGIGGIFTGTSDADAGAVASGAVAFPLGLNYLLGGKRHAFEAGVTLNPYYLSTDLHSPTAPRGMDQNGWGTHGFLDLGYRFQPLNNGLVFRVNWTPLVSPFVAAPQIFGISAGYGFK